MTRLLDDLTLAKATGSYLKHLDNLAKVDVLVLDDWGIAPIKEHHRQDILEVLSDRIDARSTIITSQLPVDKWRDYVADPTVADAVCDRR